METNECNNLTLSRIFMSECLAHFEDIMCLVLHIKITPQQGSHLTSNTSNTSVNILEV